MITELQFAARRLLKSPWSAGAAVLIAAIGTGLNTAVFAVTYGVLLRPLPYHNPPRLALVEVGVPLPRVADWRDQLASFERVAAYTAAGSIVRGLDEPRFAPVASVDEEFFATLGTAALAGRTFGRGEDAVAVLSERVAEQTGIPTAGLLGRNIVVGDVPATVIGIMPATFAFPSQATAVWVPARSSAAIAFDKSRDERRFRLVGRLEAGVTLTQANEAVGAARRQLVPGFKGGSNNRPPVSLLKETIVGPVRPVLAVFVVSAAFALLIASANVATLLLGLALARRREFRVRAALGASRWQLFVSIFSESIVIAAAGALLGLAFAVGAVSVIGSWGAGILPRLADVRVDWLVFAFAAAITSLAAVLGAAPAIHTIAKETVTAREAIGGTRAAVRVRRVLLAVQIGLAALLLSIGALLTRSVYGLLSGDLGVESRGVLVSQLMVTNSMSFDAIGRRAWMQELTQRLRSVSGAMSAGVGSSLPPDNAPLVITASFGASANVTETPELSLASVTPGYLEALGTRLLRGRHFEDADEQRGDLVVLLSDSAATIFFNNAEAVGAQLPIELPGIRGRGRPTVLGVVADVKYSGLEAAPGPAVYVLWKELPAGQLYLAVKTQQDSTAVASSVRTVLREVAPDMPVMPIRRLDEVMQRSVADRRLRALLGAGMAGVAFVIALAGLAAGLGRLVSERRGELAIRAALGASPRRMLRSVMLEGMLITLAGMILGTIGTLAAAGMLRALVFGISPQDPATLAFVSVVVGTGAVVACYLPARRASAVDPLEVLRDN